MVKLKDYVQEEANIAATKLIDGLKIEYERKMVELKDFEQQEANIAATLRIENL